MDEQTAGKNGNTGGSSPLFLAACVTVLAVVAAAGPVWGEDMKLWPDGAPGAKGTQENDTPTLKIFPPSKYAKGPTPAVLLIPGGGYKHISGYGTFWEFFQTRPVRFFSMKYRLPVHGYLHPAPLQDAKRAVATIRANAKEWNIDPKRVVVVAFSSGGHVATTLATHYDLGKPDAKDPVERFSSRPDYMALFCSVVSMKNHPHGPSVARLLGPNPDAKLIDDLSNELQVNASTPPTFLAHAKDDGLVPPENSILYHEALKKAGVATTLQLYQQGGHDVTNRPNPWKAHLGDWISETGILPEGTARPAPGAAKIHEPTTSYTVKTLASWQVYVHNALLPGGEHAETGAAAMKRLTDAMVRVKTWIPADPQAKLLKVKIWLEVNSTKGPHGGTSAYQYHPGLDWLIDMDFNPDKHKCVEFGNAASLAKGSDDSSANVLLHELAHAYHDQILSFDNPDVLAAHKRAREEGKYPPGDWVVGADHKEFFAGVTTRYFGTKEERDAVGQRDPILERFLLKTWGKPEANMDTPWAGTKASK
jgi:acetyl esterase/lipase